MIDDKLLWSRNLKHIGTKLDQTPMRIRTFCWKHDNVNLKTKMKLYNSVFLPVITYASGVWFKEIRTKSTYIDKLIVIAAKSNYTTGKHIFESLFTFSKICFRLQTKQIIFEIFCSDLIQII